MGKENGDKKYYKDWYEKNKDKHLEYCREKIKCDCGLMVRRSNMTSHKKTQKHIEYIKDITKKYLSLKDKYDILEKKYYKLKKTKKDK